MRKLFHVFLVLDALALLGVIWGLASSPRWVNQTRNALLSWTEHDPAWFEASPERLVDAGFRTDPPALVEEWRRRLDEDVDYLDGVRARLAPLPEIDRVKALVRLFSKNGGGGCGAYRDLLHNVVRVHAGSGSGCCSDHSQVFIALATWVGIFAREVHHTSHTFDEFWVSDPGQWVWVDPHYAILARDPDGAYLSLLELRRRYLSDEPVVFEFIGNRYHRFARVSPTSWPLYDEPEDFSTISLTWGNNVYEEDRFYRRLGSLPKAPSQLLGFLAGVKPPLMLYEDAHSLDAIRLRRARVAYLSLAGVLVAGTLAWPASRLVARLRRG